MHKTKRYNFFARLGFIFNLEDAHKGILYLNNKILRQNWSLITIRNAQRRLTLRDIKKVVA